MISQLAHTLNLIYFSNLQLNLSTNKTNNDYNLVVTLSTSVKFCCSANQETETELLVGAGTFSRKEVIPKGEPLSFSFS